MSKFNSMFGRMEKDTCRLAMTGEIAVKTSTGYKSYDLKNNRLTNCSDFVFDIGEEFFFIVPAITVAPGDIILSSGVPKCVTKVDGGTITVVNYENSAVETLLPEHHIFMGNSFFYSKIVSMFGNDISGDEKGMTRIFEYMALAEMMKGNGNSGMNPMFVYMLMKGGNFESIFGDLFKDKNETL